MSINNNCSDIDFSAFAKLVAVNQGLKAEKLTPNSMVSSDLGLAGDDVLDLLNLLSSRYGTDFSKFPLTDVAGPEAAFNPIVYVVQILKRNRKKLHDVSLGQLFNAVQNGKWD